MDLNKLLKEAGVKTSLYLSPSLINKISCDSRDVESNDLFVSVHGPNSFIYAQSALEKGAKVFISNQET